MKNILLFVASIGFGIIFFYKYRTLLEKYHYDIVELESETDILERKNNTMILMVTFKNNNLKKSSLRLKT